MQASKQVNSSLGQRPFSRSILLPLHASIGRTMHVRPVCLTAVAIFKRLQEAFVALCNRLYAIVVVLMHSSTSHWFSISYFRSVYDTL